MPEPEAPVELQDKPVEVPEAPETDKPDGTEDSIFEFNPNEIPEEARPHVEALQKQWQSSYSQKRQAESQELAEIRREAEQAQQIVQGLQNPQTQAQVLAALGLELAEEEEDPFAFEEEPDPQARIDQLEARFAQQAEEQALMQQAEDELNYVVTEIEALEGTEDREFSAEENVALADLARINRTPDGRPDVKKAHELLNGLYSQRQQSWIKSKSAPRRPGSGTPASKAADLTTREGRREAAAEAAEAAMASQ